MYEINVYDKIIFDLRKVFQLVRGTLRYAWRKNMHTKILCGKRVQIRNIRFLSVSGNLKIEDYVELDALSIGGIKLGNNVKIGRYTSIRASNHYRLPGKGVVIGDNFSCGDYTFFGCAGGIKIGNDVMMGQNIRFHAQNHNFDNLDELLRLQGTSSRGIAIGNNCWIGSGTVFLDGSSIGNGCVVGANSLITKSFPNNCVIMGQPAKIVRYRGDEERP